MNLKLLFACSVVLQFLGVGCVSVSTVGKIGAQAFYSHQEVVSPLLWEEVLNDALSRRAFVLYSNHTMPEYLTLTRLEGVQIRYKINRTETNVVWVCDFPLAGESTKFTVHEDPVRKRMLITETGDMCQDGCTQLAGDRFEVSVNVSENLVKHYIHRTYNPVECYPFLEEAVKKVFGPRSEFCLVAPMLKTDSSVMIYTCNGGFWNLTLPLVTDIENIKCFCEYPAMFVVAVESFPLDDFWESVNLSTDEAKYWHSYFLKLFELGFLKCSFIYMK